jgi:hypothetical protein
MSKSNTWESDLLKLVFQNINAADIGDATGLRGSVGAGDLWLSLHTADPTEGGTQTSSETTYTGYTRVSVARSNSTWTVSGTAPTQVTNAAQVNFPQCTDNVGAPHTITHVGIGTASSGTGKLLYSGALGLSGTLAVSQNITPSYAPGAFIITED